MIKKQVVNAIASNLTSTQCVKCRIGAKNSRNLLAGVPFFHLPSFLPEIRAAFIDPLIVGFCAVFFHHTVEYFDIAG